MIDELKEEYLIRINQILSKTNYDISSDNIFEKKYCFLKDNLVVGFIDYSIYYDRVELNYIVVDEIYRNQGIASSLIKFMIEDAKQKNCVNITLEVNEFNTPAINLYKKFNFKQVAVRKNYYKNAQALLLELKLEGELSEDFSN